MSDSIKPYRSILENLRKHYLLWLVPTIAFGALSVVYALFGPSKWQAAQTFLIRDELIGRSYDTPGRFESMELLKSTQEFISEVAHKPNVIRSTLQSANIKNEFDGDNQQWPSDKLIEETQEQVSIIAPGGSEFGKTEMLELRITGDTRENAKKLVGCLTEEIDKQLRKIRIDRAQSMADELSESVAMAKENLDEASIALKQMESELGSDLAELRNLNNPNSVGSSLQSTLVTVRAEIRAAITEDEQLKKQLILLKAAQEDIAALRSTPEQILLLLPVLNDLKEGMVKAQLEQSQKLGKYSENHPVVTAGNIQIERIQDEIRKELATTIQGKKKERSIATQKIERLQKENSRLSARLSEISNKRVEYEKLTALVNQRYQSLSTARNELDRMNSIAQAAAKVDLLTRVDVPSVGTRPVGLARRYVVLSGTGLGFLLGVGFVMMFAAPTIPPIPSVTSKPQAGTHDSEFKNSPSVRSNLLDGISEIVVLGDKPHSPDSIQSARKKSSIAVQSSKAEVQPSKADDAKPITNIPNSFQNGGEPVVDLPAKQQSTLPPDFVSEPQAKKPFDQSSIISDTENSVSNAPESSNIPDADPTSQAITSSKTTIAKDNPSVRRPTASELFMMDENKSSEEETAKPESKKPNPNFSELRFKTKSDKQSWYMSDKPEPEAIQLDDQPVRDAEPSSLTEIEKVNELTTDSFDKNTKNDTLDASRTSDFANMDTLIVVDEDETSIVVDDRNPEAAVIFDSSKTIEAQDFDSKSTSSESSTGKFPATQTPSSFQDKFVVPIAQTLVLDKGEISNVSQKLKQEQNSSPVPADELPNEKKSSLDSESKKPIVPKAKPMQGGGSIFVFPSPSEEPLDDNQKTK